MNSAHAHNEFTASIKLFFLLDTFKIATNTITIGIIKQTKIMIYNYNQTSIDSD